MDQNWKIGSDDIEFLKDIGSQEISLVAQKWAKRKDWDIMKAEGNCRSWLDRIRKRIVRCQVYLNKIRTLQRTNPRIRKLSTSGKLPKQEAEDEEFLA